MVNQFDSSPAPLFRCFVSIFCRVYSARNHQMDEFAVSFSVSKPADRSIISQFYSMILKAYLYLYDKFWTLFCLGFVLCDRLGGGQNTAVKASPRMRNLGRSWRRRGRQSWRGRKRSWRGREQSWRRRGRGRTDSLQWTNAQSMIILCVPISQNCHNCNMHKGLWSYVENFCWADDDIKVMRVNKGMRRKRCKMDK